MKREYFYEDVEATKKMLAILEYKKMTDQKLCRKASKKSKKELAEDEYEMYKFREELGYNFKDVDDIVVLPDPLETTVTSVQIPLLGVKGRIVDYLDSRVPEYEVRIRDFVVRSNNRSQDIAPFNFPLDWLHLSNYFIQELLTDDVFTLTAYTNIGDKLANAELRNEFVDINNFKQGSYSIEQGPPFPLFVACKNLLKQIVRPQQAFGVLSQTNQANADELLRAVRNPNAKNSELYKMILEARHYFTDEFYKFAIREFIKNLEDIINRAPVLTEDAILYRGVKDVKYLSNDARTFLNVQFMSTSYSPRVAFEYADKRIGCCVKKLRVPAGTKCIWMEPVTLHAGEHEVLLPPQLKFKILSHERAVKLEVEVEDGYRTSYLKNVCSPYTSDMDVTTMQLIS